MQAQIQPPNFVFLMTDTQGANIVGAYGHPELNTPNIDKLAANGVKGKSGRHRRESGGSRPEGTPHAPRTTLCAKFPCLLRAAR